jgi:signal recognition particle receptor subunit beta
MSARSYKVLFIGEPNAGKTTCIAAISDIAPVTTDVACTDVLSELKETTTVALDYGELNLGKDGRMLLYGLPGQPRFKFMFDVVREGLIGVVILVDASRPNALASLNETLATYSDEIRTLPCVLALNKHLDPPMSLRREFQQVLHQHEMVLPIIAIDARKRADIVFAFELLFTLLEHGPTRLHTEESIEWI